MNIIGNTIGAYVDRFLMDDGSTKSTGEILKYILETISNSGNGGNGTPAGNEDYRVEKLPFLTPQTSISLSNEETITMVTYVGTSTFSIGTSPGATDILPPTPAPPAGHETHVIHYFNPGPSKTIYFNGPGTLFIHLAKKLV